MKKIFLTLVLVQAILCCSVSLAAEKILRIAIIQEWSTFNPVTSQLASNDALFSFMIRKMVNRAASGKVIPDVAESIPPLKNKLAIWKIKANAKWADGHEISCEDWNLGWKIGLSPNVSVETRTTYSKISKMTWDAKTPQTCVVEYAQQDWSYDRDLPPFIPAHLDKTIFEKTSKDSQGYDRNSTYVVYPNLAGLYNGPYAVSEFKLGSHIILTRNKFFFGTKPEFDKVIVTLVPDTGSLKANLSSGQIDAISAVGFPSDTALQFDDDFQDKKSLFQVHFQSSAIFQGVFFNLDNEILKDVNVREALSRAIDKEALVKAFYNNKLIPAEGILPPQHPSFRKHASIHSKKMAQAILEKAGWKLNATNIREKEGKKLSFVFKTSSGIKVLENIQIYLCDQFKDIGVQCVIKNEPPRILLGSSVPHGEFDLAMFGQPIPPDTSLSSYFATSEIPTNANSWTGGNSMRIKSLQLDQMLKDFDQELKMKIRNQIIQKIEKFFETEYTFIPLYHRREAIVLPKRIEGVAESFEGTSFFEPENWKYKKN